MNILSLPNVSMSKHEHHESDYKRALNRCLAFVNSEDELGPMVGASELFKELVQKLVVDKPEWRFEIFDYYKHAINTVYIAFNGVIIKDQHGEELGSIKGSSRYERAGTVDVVQIYNKRIGRTKQRGNGFTTKDIKAALRQINKQFFEKTDSEVVSEAEETANQVLLSQFHASRNIVHRHRNTLEHHALDYILEHAEEAFADYVDRTTNGLSGTTKNKLDDLREAQLHMHTIEDVSNKFSANKTALVIRTRDKYIVNIDSQIKLCDDSDLPQNIKAKLGMLKLVEEGQVISDTGCRVNKETFVVVLDTIEEKVQ